jgi:uncharacterized protein YjiS (DUF1127 family)
MEPAMTDTVLHPPAIAAGAASRLGRSAVRLGRALSRMMLASATRRALDDLSDNMLTDIGLSRGDIPFVAKAVAAGRADATRDPLDRLNWTVAQQNRGSTAARCC